MNTLQKIVAVIGSIALMGCTTRNVAYHEAQDVLQASRPAQSQYCLRIEDSLDETDVRLSSPVAFFDYLLRPHGIHVVNSRVRQVGFVEGIVETNDGSTYWVVMNSFQKLNDEGMLCGQGIIPEWAGVIRKEQGPGPQGTDFLEQLIGTRCDASDSKRYWERKNNELACNPGNGKLVLQEWKIKK